jgi:hypothetical protein
MAIADSLDELAQAWQKRMASDPTLVAKATAEVVGAGTLNTSVQAERVSRIVGELNGKAWQALPSPVANATVTAVLRMVTNGMSLPAALSTLAEFCRPLSA